MDDDIRAFGMELGGRAIARDWAGVHALLAPWMRATWSIDGVQQFFEDEYRSTLEASGTEAMHYPEGTEPELGGNDLTNPTELREPIEWQAGRVRPVPPELTDENMRYWLKVQLPCSEEQVESLGLDFFCEVWLAVAATPEGLRVGYWSQGAY